MTRFAGTLALVGLLCAPAWSEELKTTRIALFSSGVGYFESAMTAEGTTSATLKFRVDQINDVLKSLVLRDLDGGTVSTVQYPSRDPVDKALKSFAVDISGRPTLAELLNQLRGVPVVIKAPSPVTGAIVGLEKQTILTPLKTTIERDVLTLLTDEGLRSFALPDVAGVKILDEAVEGELRKALETLAASHDSEKKTVVCRFAGEGRRRIRVGYILETPIWKTTYRLVLDEEGKPYLQGWAIVENATEQDWEDVRLSLVSGRPISYVMDLYQPLYVPRPVERLALYESLRPPTYESGFGDFRASAAPRPGPGMLAAKARRSGGLGGGRYLRGGGGARGGNLFGGGSAEAEWEEEAADEDDVHLAGEGVASLASAQDAGELFEYVIQTPVSLKRRHSAMLPIVTTEIEGDKLSVFNPRTHPKHPLNGLKLKNTTGLHLMQGPVTVFDGGIYAGDAKLPDLRADEERLIAYALDLSVEVRVKQHPEPEAVTQVRIAKGMLWRVRKLVDKREYILKHKDESPRTVLVEQHVGPGWKLVEPSEAEERTGSTLRFKVVLAGGETQSLVVRTERQVEDQYVLAGLDSKQIVVIQHQRVLSESVKQALTRVVELRGALEETVRQIERVVNEAKTIDQEQRRIRENMKVLSGKSEVFRRYEHKLDVQETRLEELHDRTMELRGLEQTRRTALEAYVQSLDVQ